MKILVTGGTGLVGGRLIPRLVEAGHEVFALTRSASSHGRLKALGASPVDADLESRAPLSLPAVDSIVHAAALFRFSGPRQPYFRTNVDGTAALLKAAEKAGARTFVYISAAGIIMDDAGSAIRHADESAPTFPNHSSAYLASKAQAEAIVLAANKPGFRTIALRPPAIWGPGDPFSRALPTAIKSGQFAFIDRGDYAFSTCHVDNVVEAVQCALQRGEGGQASSSAIGNGRPSANSSRRWRSCRDCPSTGCARFPIGSLPRLAARSMPSGPSRGGKATRRFRARWCA
ncbi:NAD-dependent epimerase/dehydratase family protein [Mesorhizobium amorphae]|uniref:NAD-dependent epimerase/dehydratase family protein n=1 Tax=Mesorhizobium amorphae TaxID=71433 RepID=UPI001C9282F9|nr:NAD-dependent epimerase/dehydratase family protein [Mesorhizobium amorphae]